MHITILALGSTGDILPYTALGKGLKKAGHQVRFITFESFAPHVAECGLDFHPIQGDPRSLVAQGGANIFSLARSFGSLAESYAQDLSAPHLGETDLFINQLPGGLYGFDLSQKHGFPMVMAAAMPLKWTNAFPLMGFPKLPLPGYNKATYYFGEQIVWLMYRGVINRWRKETLNLPPLPLAGYFNLLGTERFPILNGFSPSVVERPADWGEHIHITGYWFPDDEEWAPPADLLDFLNSGPPPVFIGFGSMPVKNPQKTTALIIEALKISNQRGILHMGWSELGDQVLPATVYKISFAPYSWLFPRMGMVIHHGGAGTTAAALRAGVPSGVVPFIFDQHYWGERILALGAGPEPIRFKQLTAETLTETIRRGISDQDMRQKAADLGEKIRGENGIGNAVDIINQLLNSRTNEKMV